MEPGSRVGRVIDVNLNRLTEGLRVVEDVARLVLEDRQLLAGVRRLRTEAGGMSRGLRRRVMLARQSDKDPGRGDRFDRTRRRGIEDVLFANLRRAEESCRVLEELLKLTEPKLAPEFKEFRFRLYDIEAAAVRRLDLPGADSILRPTAKPNRRRHAQR
jgi:thiamine-phosphate pyrophosphorylase